MVKRGAKQTELEAVDLEAAFSRLSQALARAMSALENLQWEMTRGLQEAHREAGEPLGPLATDEDLWDWAMDQLNANDPPPPPPSALPDSYRRMYTDGHLW